MLLLRIKLVNYIGIYNGTGRNEIEFDFSDVDKKIIAIRGANGSGKSTLLKAINPFPDRVDMIIPGLAGRKELVYYKPDGYGNGNIYKIIINYPIKTNGDRGTTQVAIIKDDINLNESLNVSTAKDIIYNEFELDNNYITLSQLSSEDRGLADKRPAERKKFVNDILSDLTVYNNMYKVLNKKSSVLKSLVNSISIKISQLGGGDISTLQLNLKQDIKQLNSYNDIRDEIIKEISKVDNTLSTIKSAEDKYNELSKEIDRYQNTIESILHKMSSTKTYQTENIDVNQFISIDNTYRKEKVNDIKYAKLNFQVGIKSLTKQINSLKEELKAIESDSIKQAKQLESVTKQLLVYNDTGVDSAKFMEDYKELESKMNTVYDSIKHKQVLSIDFTIETLDFILMQLRREFEYFKTDIPKVTFDDLLDSPENIPQHIQEYKNYIANLEKKQKELINDNFVQLSTDEYILDKIPDKCNVEDCYFRQLVIKQQMENDKISEIKAKIKNIDGMIQNNKNLIENKQNQYEYYKFIKNYNAILESIMETLSKLQSIYNDTRVFVSNTNPNFKIIDFLEDIRDDFNSKKMYLSLKEDYLRVKDQYFKIKDNLAMITELESRCSEINKEIAESKAKYNELNSKLSASEEDLEHVKFIVEDCNVFLAEHEKLDMEMEEYIKIYNKYKSYKDIIAPKKEFSDQNQKLNQDLYDINHKISSARSKVDADKQAIRLLEEYMREYDVYKANYKKIETIKKYTSPTTGIQTLFMETYMNNVLIIANQLLALMFDGRFVLQPFIINESEFRIPCAGNGYLNDDISSMSTSQICIISMIISFAMLYNSSSCYNILKLDEIDGGLDTNNRFYFVQMLDNIMKIMNCQQCFIISHNMELDTVDVHTIEIR